MEYIYWKDAESIQCQTGVCGGGAALFQQLLIKDFNHSNDLFFFPQQE